ESGNDDREVSTTAIVVCCGYVKLQDLRKETSVLLSSLLFKAPRSRRTRKVWNGHVSPSSSLDTHQPDQGTLCHVVRTSLQVNTGTPRQ
uniref:Uncharacterized protein n=1 Tax=Triticum urartu TaxID=4572 RepID=A0A8R7QE94_TRIUA